MPRNSHSVSRNAIRGVGLIEVLVAILVLAVGLLGIAALQATTLRNSQGALERSQAVIGTYDILDSMRANVAAAQAGAYDLAVMTCAAPAISNLATRDLAGWMGNLQQQLGPSACGMIEPLGGNVFRVTVQWNEQRGVSGVSQQLLTETRL